VDDYKHFMDQVLIIARAADALAIRVTQLEKLVQYPNTAKQDMREAAAKAQANEHLYAPLRSDTAPLIRLAAFARRLLDPSDLGYAVSREIRDLARDALGMDNVPDDGYWPGKDLEK
jgi:hypothetical protein